MCPYEEKLTAWLLGDLSPEEQETVTRHLGACVACRGVRDALAAVLAPLQSGLAKDTAIRLDVASSSQGGASLNKPPPCGRPLQTPGCGYTATPFGKGAWVLWLRAAALMLVSFGVSFALISLYYNEATSRKTPVGPVTTYTFHKREQPPEPLEPMPPFAGAKGAPPLAFDMSVTLPPVAGITIPEIPAYPGIFVFAQLPLWVPTNSVPFMSYDDFLAQQQPRAGATNATEGVPVLVPNPHINAYPRIR